ncbi:hypothetical protein [Botrimarina sp.]|uniref:baeRF3 domain-containing protein n=1 Tax=Botrimarina sp. TaxID=2795802 RepID=UPI0032F0999C
MLTRADLTKLAEKESRPAVTLYMPTHRRGRETRQDPIRFGNLLKQADSQAAEQGAEEAESVRELLAAVQGLEEDQDFWAHQSDGLCLFLGEGVERVERVPISLEEHVVVGERFDVAPLLPILSWRRPFFILKIDQHGAALLKADGEALVEQPLDSEYDSIAAAAPGRNREGALQFHSASSPRAQRRGEGPIYHGNAADKDAHAADMRRYLAAVDAAVTDSLRDQEGPLVLACVEETNSLYRELSECDRLVDDYVEGAPDGKSEDELRLNALALVKGLERRDTQQAVQRYGDATGQGLTLDTPERIVEAAKAGQVDTLLLSEADGTSYSGQQSDAARAALLTGSDIFVVDEDLMPSPSGIAALLRYQV